MRAAVARNGQLRIDDMPDPTPGPGEVLVQVRACGICGSDLHALRYADQLVETAVEAGAPLVFDPSRDYVMGHEFTAEVVELGPATEGAAIAAGDLVTSFPVAITPTGVEAVGAYSNNYNGGYAELMRLTAGVCLKVPNGLDHRRAALTEPMSVGRHAVSRADVTPDEAAIVLGAGPVGLAVVAELQRVDIESIVVSDYSPRRREVAAAMGVTHVVDPATESPLDVWQREDGRRPLVVFDAIGVPGTLGEAMRIAPPLSRVCVVGSCMEQDAFRPLLPQSKQLTIVFSFAYDPWEFGDTLRAIAEGEIDVTPMITGTCGIDGVPDAFDALHRPDDHVKVLVEPGGPDRVEAISV